MKTQIWATFCDVKYKAYLISILVNKYQKWDRNINIFTALASSTSVASWIIWEKYQLIWSIIIVLSQIVTVVKPYFPYFKYVRELSDRSQKIDSLSIDFEKLWHDFQVKTLNTNEASALYFNLKKSLNEILNFGDDIIFSTSKNDEQKANQKMKVYLKNNFNIEINLPPKN
jgi:hypothetical protein